MSNSNMEPMPYRRLFGGPGTSTSRTLAELAASVAAPQDEDAFVDVTGLAKVRQTVTGACRKCGYPGHLPFQCRNYIQLKPGQSTVIDISSTSSESSEEDTPLVENKKQHIHKKKKKEKKKKRHRKHSSSSSDSDHHHHKKKKKRKRRHSNSSSDDHKKSKKRKH